MSDFETIIKKKIVSHEDLVRQINTLKFFGKKIIFTNGCFDIMHAGHTYYLNKARSLGDILVVGLNSDDSVKKLNKGSYRPIHTQNKRAEVLASLLCVDFVAIFEEETPLTLIQKVIPNILVKGGDYTESTIVGADIVKKNGGSIEIIPLLEGYSTTGIINKLK